MVSWISKNKIAHTTNFGRFTVQVRILHLLAFNNSRVFWWHTNLFRGYIRNGSSPFIQQHVGYCGVAKKALPVGRWRSAPACCAAQSVLRRGPFCGGPLHRLARAVQIAPPERNPPSKRSGNSNSNGSCITRIWL